MAFVWLFSWEKIVDELSLGLVSIKRQMPRPRLKNKTIIGLRLCSKQFWYTWTLWLQHPKLDWHCNQLFSFVPAAMIAVTIEGIPPAPRGGEAHVKILTGLLVLFFGVWNLAKSYFSGLPNFLAIFLGFAKFPLFFGSDKLPAIFLGLPIFVSHTWILWMKNTQYLKTKS